MSVGVSVSDELKISHAKKLSYGSWSEVLGSSPLTNSLKTRQSSGVRRKKERTALSRPGAKLVCPCSQFLADFVGAAEDSRCVSLIDPFPECRHEIESVMQVFRGDEDVGIEQVQLSHPYLFS